MKQENRTGLRPLGVAVLIEPFEPERRVGKIVIPENVSDRTTMLENRARVIAVGPAAWHDEPTPRAQPGDIVLVTKFAGAMAKSPVDGKVYRFVNDRDIYAGMDDVETNVVPLSDTVPVVRSSDEDAEVKLASFIRRDGIGGANG